MSKKKLRRIIFSMCFGHTHTHTLTLFHSLPFLIFPLIPSKYTRRHASTHTYVPTRQHTFSPGRNRNEIVPVFLKNYILCLRPLALHVQAFVFLSQTFIFFYRLCTEAVRTPTPCTHLVLFSRARTIENVISSSKVVEV